MGRHSWWKEQLQRRVKKNRKSGVDKTPCAQRKQMRNFVLLIAMFHTSNTYTVPQLLKNIT